MAQIEKEHEAPAKGNYAFVSLGCPKNTVDSERMLGLLQLDGYQLVGDPKNADFVVVNTCGFIEEARKESYGAIDEMIALKNDGVIKGVVVSGCLAERQKEELLEERPEIDSLVGVFGREEVTKIADRLLGDLEDLNDVAKPTRSARLWGEWRLVYTDSPPMIKNRGVTVRAFCEPADAHGFVSFVVRI